MPAFEFNRENVYLFLLLRDRCLQVLHFEIKIGHVYEARTRKDHRGGDLIFDALSFIWSRS